MATIFVRVPEETHIVICRGKSAARADHEIIHADDLQVFLEAHILRHLKPQLGTVNFKWENPEDWRIFLQGETVRIIVFSEGESSMQGHHATIKRRDDPHEMVILTSQAGT